jgi:membrane protease YdiL (CAAX protease family)
VQLGEQPQPGQQWWNWWQAPLELIANFVIAIAAALLFSVLFWGTTYLDDDQLNISGFLAECTMLGLLVWRAQTKQILPGDLWSHWPVLPAQTWLLLATLLFIWTVLSDRVQLALFPDDVEQDIQQWVGSLSGRTWFLAAFGAVVTAPLIEEVLFRRILLHAWIRTPLGFWGAAVLSSLFWSAVHFYSYSTTVLIFLGGLLLCLLARAVRSIWPGVLVHAAYNLYATHTGLLYLSGQ